MWTLDHIKKTGVVSSNRSSGASFQHLRDEAQYYCLMSIRSINFFLLFRDTSDPPLYSNVDALPTNDPRHPPVDIPFDQRHIPHFSAVKKKERYSTNKGPEMWLTPTGPARSPFFIYPVLFHSLVHTQRRRIQRGRTGWRPMTGEVTR